MLFFRSTNHGMVLVLDGVIQVTESDEFSYQEMIAHIPMFAHGNAEKVLVIGGGDGGVLREVRHGESCDDLRRFTPHQLTLSRSQICKHQGVKEVVICEIDEDVISYSKKYLPSLACGYDDPRVTVKVMDGAEFMRQNPGVFDVIITDSSDPIGPASVLFEAPFYRGMYDALADGGIICTQGECMWLHKDLIKPLVDKVSEFCSTGERCARSEARPLRSATSSN